jgi:uncharacterized membrane protein YuzA (DUF378 family)
MKALEWIATILVIAGGLNLGILGISGTNVIESLVGQWPVFLGIVYDLVGLSALWLAYHACKGM